MIHRSNLGQALVALLLIALLVLLCDPFMVWMPPFFAMAALLGAVVLLCLWAGLVMREHGGDEREAAHRMFAGRVAYISGIAVLTVALVVQTLAHQGDPWVMIALGAMIASKVGARMWADRYR